ncbi:phosphate ABC transporter, inner membrane subunit PstA [Nitrosococcus halophilus Nc 4]|uniref:Phosphate transport system permease protein PstA n=1 Tax=Nitrosococcus halophilus (strain Nc4) TaxID=472759 RepID=D5BV29_NITHN|nr:phosphate ABC transporter permease PstA [Nitrosococcus halophilus]ADE15379.1 phosphate ABC transporter, inner membrane subunit PstA [Nitrosococcus halophilus Nc 4]
MKEWFKSGTPWVWLSAGAVSASVVMVAGLLVLIAVKGLGHFWPAQIAEIEYTQRDGEVVRLIGEVVNQEQVARQRLLDRGYTLPEAPPIVTRNLLKIGNRDFFGFDFLWIVQPLVNNERYPKDLMAVERREWGHFYGYLQSVKEQDRVVAEGENVWEVLQQRLARANELHVEIEDIEKHDIGAINYQLEQLRLRRRGLELEGVTDPQSYAEVEAEEAELRKAYATVQKKLNELYQQIRRDSLTAEIADGRVVEIPLAKVVRAYRPNGMGIGDKSRFYLAKLSEFVTEDPREANTEGGIFPAIFGTVMMVLIMSVIVTPFGVVAAVYLREYAKQGPLIRIIRIAVNNLAGVPSIVYGVFGLGFFVYFLGGNVDRWFFPEALPAPTFGTPGLLWASLTLAILTVPVVIVATEEGLSRIPRSIREGSLALGATRAETLWRTVLPMAAPAMMTGLILAVARAAGEVAPLMMVGVVKLAPSLPLDGNFPFLHLDRKFMHLGFHIYDVGFQSPNVEAARPLVYATALLLVLIIVGLNLTAIMIRNRLREKYRAAES